MGLDEAVNRLVAGVGFRHGTSTEEILALVRAALASLDADPSRLHSLATADDRAGEDAIREAAGRLGVALIGIAPADLRAVDARVETRSSRIAASRGVGSVAEAAALAVVGAAGCLALPRIATAGATCALAAFAADAPRLAPAPVCGQTPTP